MTYAVSDGLTWTKRDGRKTLISGPNKRFKKDRKKGWVAVVSYQGSGLCTLAVLRSLLELSFYGKAL